MLQKQNKHKFFISLFALCGFGAFMFNPYFLEAPVRSASAKAETGAQSFVSEIAVPLKIAESAPLPDELKVDENILCSSAEVTEINFGNLVQGASKINLNAPANCFGLVLGSQEQIYPGKIAINRVFTEYIVKVVSSPGLFWNKDSISQGAPVKGNAVFLLSNFESHLHIGVKNSSSVYANGITKPFGQNFLHNHITQKNIIELGMLIC